MQGLDRATVSVPFGVRGIQSKLDPLQVDKAYVLALSNGTFDAPGAISKRNGYAQIGTPIPNAFILTTFSPNTSTAVANGSPGTQQPQEAVVCDGSSLWVVDSSGLAPQNQGNLPNVNISQFSVQHDSNSDFQQNVAVAPNGLQLYTWVQGGASPGLYYSVINGVDGTYHVRAQLISATGFAGRAFTDGVLWHLFYFDSAFGAIMKATLASTAPLNGFFPTALTTQGGGDNQIDPSASWDATLIAGTPQAATAIGPFTIPSSPSLSINGTPVTLFAGPLTAGGLTPDLQGAGISAITILTDRVLISSSDVNTPLVIAGGASTLAALGLIAGSTASTDFVYVSFLALSGNLVTWALSTPTLTIAAINIVSNFAPTEIHLLTSADGCAPVIVAGVSGSSPAALTYVVLSGGIPASLYTIVTGTITTAVATGLARNYTGWCSDVLGDSLFIAWAAFGSVNTPYLYTSQYCQVPGYVAGPNVSLQWGCTPSGKAFQADGDYYIPLVYDSAVQPINYTMQVTDPFGTPSTQVIARYNTNSAGSAQRGFLPESPTGQQGATEQQGDTVILPTLLRESIITSANAAGSAAAVFQPTGVVATPINFSTNLYSLPHCESGQSLLFGGGFPWMYDGFQVVEHGFHRIPEQLTLTSAYSTPPFVLQYQYLAIFSWYDSHGLLHRSGTSIPATINTTVPIGSTAIQTNNGPWDVSGGGGLTLIINGINVPLSGGAAETPALLVSDITSANVPGVFAVIDAGNANSIYIYSTGSPGSLVLTGTALTVLGLTGATTVVSVAVTVAPLTQTAKTNVMIEIYRTQANVPGFNRAYVNTAAINSPLNPIMNIPSVTPYVFTDTVQDASVAAAPPVYTEGQITNAEPGPIANYTVWQNRVWALSSTNSFQIYFSQPSIPGQTPVEFNSQFVLNIDPRGGPITGLGYLGQWLVIFKRDVLFLMSGNLGPDFLGNNTDFQAPYQAIVDVGCSNPRSIVQTPNGLMFFSDKGLFLLTPGPSTTYLGAPMQAFNASTITSATLLSTDTQIRWSTANGTTIIYDYFVDAWSTFTPQSAIDATLVAGAWTWLRQSDGTIWAETPGVYVDPGNQWISLSVMTAWMELAGFQGWMRFYEANLKGKYGSNALLNVALAYDGITSQTQLIQWNLTSSGAFGTFGPYGLNSPPPYGQGQNQPVGKYGGAWPLDQVRLFPTRQQCQAVSFTISDAQMPGQPVGQGLAALSAIALEYGARQGKNWAVANAASAG